jgi:hypothetical protein
MGETERGHWSPPPGECVIFARGDHSNGQYIPILIHSGPIQLELSALIRLVRGIRVPFSAPYEMNPSKTGTYVLI